MTLAQLHALGFDRANHVPFTKQFAVKCSQCKALCVNGVPTHEHGCPNSRHECKGCDELIPARQKYCENCS